jgi:hypothetical protein
MPSVTLKNLSLKGETSYEKGLGMPPYPSNCSFNLSKSIGSAELKVV